MQSNHLLYSHYADIELIHKVKAGRAECYETLVRRHNKTLYRIGRGFGLSRAQTEDLMVELLSDMWSELADFDVRHSYRPYLSSRMIAACRTLLEGEGWKAAAEIPSLVDGSVLEQEIAALPLEQRLPVLLCEIESLSEAEAASLLQISKSAVQAQLRAAREHLRPHLQSWYYGADVYHCPADCSDHVTDQVMSQLAQPS